MATYTSIPAFTSGQVLTSAVMNDVKNNLDLGNAQSAYPYRNLIYNGAMQIAQRGTSVTSITGTTYNTADRWALEINALGTWTQTVENDAPTGSGLRKSLKMLCTTADASPAAGDFLRVVQYLEGQDLQRIRKGTSSATPLVVSFWVKSNRTGVYVCELFDEDNTRQVSQTYSVSASDTWELKTLTFPADTTGAFDNDNARSLVLSFHLADGSNFTSGTLNTSWASNTNANRAAGQTNLASATNNYWQVTGVQLEAGAVSTPFEFLPYGDELQRCQRYHIRVASGDQRHIGAGFADSATAFYCFVPLPIVMRVAPTSITWSDPAHFEIVNTGSSRATSALSSSQANVSGFALSGTCASGLTDGNGVTIKTANASAYLDASAEL